jgi:hypothetical protein
MIILPRLEQYPCENLRYRKTHSFVRAQFAILGAFFYGVTKCLLPAVCCIDGSFESHIYCVATTECASTSVTGSNLSSGNVS